MSDRSELFVRLNSVPNTHVTALCYRKIRFIPRSGGVFARLFLFFSKLVRTQLNPAFSRFQTKKLRRIDCGNRYCVWSVAHPQPVNLCQPCYCDKVREPLLSISSRSAQTSSFFQFNPTSLIPTLTQFLSILLSASFLPSCLPSLPSPLLTSYISYRQKLLLSSSARTQRKP